VPAPRFRVEPGGRVLADRLQHREPTGDAAHEVLVDELAEVLEHVPPGDRLCRLERATAAERRELREQLPRLRGEELVAPVERRLQRLLAEGQVTSAAREQLERALEPSCHRLRREELRARGRELEREREPVQPVADLGHGRRALLGELEPRVDRTRPRREQPNRVVRDDLLEGACRARRRQRGDRVLVLGGQPQRRAAGRQHAEAGRAAEELRDPRRRVDQLLEVVEHEQERLRAELSRDRAGALDLERVSDLLGHELRIAQRREVDEARRQLGGELFGDGDREARLAGAARTGQRDEPRVAAEQRGDRRELEPAPDQRRRRNGQPRLEALRAPWRGERGILAQDRALQLAQLRRGLDPQLIDERAPRGLVRLERLLLPAGAVEREHVLAAEPVAVRVLGDEAVELGDERVVPPEGELDLVSQLERVEVELLESSPLRLRERLAGEVRERRAAPERERLADEAGGSLGAAGVELPLGSPDELLEALEVELAGLEAQAVGLPARLDPLGAERLPEAVHVDLERGDGRAGRIVAPDQVDEPVARNRLAGAEQERGEHGPLLRPPERDPALVRAGLDRAQHAEFHLPQTLSRRVNRATSRC